MKQKTGIYTILSVLLFSTIWNYWVPSANDYLNMVSPTYERANVDFYAYYRGGEAYLRGVEPYAGTRDGQLFIYPPTFVPLYGLLANMDYDDARNTWVVVYASLFLLTACFTVLQARPDDRWLLALVILFIVCVSYPLRYLIKQGQIDLIVGSLSFLSFLVYRWKLRWLSALILSLAAFVKLNPVLFLITFVIFFKDWKYLIWFGVWSLSIIGVSLFFFPLDWYRAFVMEVLPALTKSQTFYYNQTPLRFFAGDKWIPRIITLSGLGTLTILGFVLGRMSKQKLETSDWTNADAFFLLNALVILLFSGSAWIMAYVWFILPVAVVLVKLIGNVKPIFIAAVGLSVAAIHARLVDLPILNAINMLGAGFLIMLLVIYLFFPDSILKASSRSDGLQEAGKP
jgi:uncharacterized membrane protein YjjP (DUF1212 family)